MINFEAHSYCQSLSSIPGGRGKQSGQGGLGEILTNRPARIYEEDQIIYHMGDEAHSLYYLRRGLVKINVLSTTGRELILMLHRTGEFFGESCFCQAHRGEMAVTMEESEVVAIKSEELLGYLRDHQNALFDFLASVTRRLARSYQLLGEHSFDSLPDRLAKTLLRLAEVVGRETDRGVELTPYITQEELAQMVSARREVVSSELCRMRERGWITYDRGGKFTINRVALRGDLGA